ncbi:MAG: hypothetical protein U1E40_13035 [Amaricoccus sp.]
MSSIRSSLACARAKPAGKPAATRSGDDRELAEDAPDLEREREEDEGRVEAAVADPHRDEREDREDGIGGERPGAEVAPVREALDPGVEDVDEEDRGEEAVEPALAGVEIVGEAGVVVHPVGKEQRAGEEVERGVADDEEVELEGPDLDPPEPELEPPEVHDREQEEDHPSEVDGVDLRPRRMLDEAGEARQQPGDAEPRDQPDDHPDVEEGVVRKLRRRLHGRSRPDGRALCPAAPPVNNRRGTREGSR